MSSKKRSLTGSSGTPPVDKSSKIAEGTTRTSSKQTQYLDIKQGNGGNYCFKPTADHDIDYIGTQGVNTCVAIYIEIRKDMCFFAHINYETPPKEDDQEDADKEDDDEEEVNKGRTTNDYLINDAQKRAIVKEIKDRLTDFQWQGSWGAITTELRKSVRIICPTSNIPEKTYTGDAIISGIMEWLGISDDNVSLFPESKPNTDSAGMIIKHPLSESSFIEYVPRGQNSAPDKWEAVDADSDLESDDQGDFASISFPSNGAIVLNDDDIQEPYTTRKYRYRWV